MTAESGACEVFHKDYGIGELPWFLSEGCRIICFWERLFRGLRRKFQTHMKNNRFRAFGSASVYGIAGTALILAGCGGDNEIKTYRVAKEDSHSHAAQAEATAAAAMTERPAIPHVHGEAAADWQELPPEKMRVASYRIAGKDGKQAELAVIPLPGVKDIGLRSVNMWREELELGPLNDDQLKEQTQKVQVGDTSGLLVDLSGKRPGQTNETKTGILGAVAERGNITWFIKMAGDSELVAQQKNNFISYLKSLEFHEAAHGAPVGDAETTQVAQAPSAENPVSANTEKAPAGEKPNFKVPSNWKTKPPGPMIASAYNVEGDGQAEVTISKFPGEVGGLIANVQRWRGQLGLPQIPPDEARKSVEMIEVGGKKEAYMVDLKGTNVRTGKEARMVAVGVPFQGDTWFFKLVGDDALVGKEKTKFLEFVKNAF
jgi:hypothetical protein